MNSRQVECFLQVATLLNFRKAAETLFISQPAVTHQIRSLEQELNLLLFTREHRKITLTTAGESLYRDLMHINTLIHDSVHRAQLLSQGGQENTLTLSCTYVVDQIKLSELVHLHEARKAKFKLNLRPTDNNPDNVALWLRYGLADISFCFEDSWGNNDTIAFKPLMTARSYCLMSLYHPLSKKKVIHYHDLANQVVVRLPPNLTVKAQEDVYSKVVSEAPTTKIRMVDNPKALETIISAGQGVQFFPMTENQNSYPNEYVAAIPFCSSEQLSIGICWLKEKESKALLQLVDLICEVFSDDSTA